MIYKYAVENYYSFHSPVELDLTVTPSHAKGEKNFKTPLGQNLTKLLCVIGPNASGKTHLIDALAHFSSFIINSFKYKPDEKISIVPHYGHKEKPTNFLCEFELEKNVYKYEASLTREMVISERLTIKNNRVWKVVFSRKLNTKTKKYNFDYDEEKFPFSQKIRSNASVVSTAVQYEVPLAVKLHKFFTNIFVNDSYIFSGIMGLAGASDFYKKNTEAHKKAINILKMFDSSLEGIELRETSSTDSKGQEKKVYIPFGIHKTREKTQKIIFFDEAGGIKSAYALLPIIFQALQTGGIALIDEFEVNLHPLMLEPLLNLFISPEMNKLNAQLIFSCHSPHILNSLDKEQIILTEKFDNCYSEAWRLDTVKGIAKRENFYSKYMAGAYGAIPDI